jgi:chemotaxis protein MotB
MRKRLALIMLPLAVLAFGTTGCASMNNTDKGAIVGVLAGAATGGIIAATTSVNTGPGMGIGALAGGLIGAVIGGHMYQEVNDLQGQVDALTLERNSLRAQLAACQEEHAAHRAEIARLNERIRSLESEISRLENRVRELEAALAAKDDGPREVARYAIGNSVLFGSGKATLTPVGSAVLERALDAIRTNYPSNSIVIEGHTDSEGIGMSNWKSNWELGAARALAVLHYLEDEGNIAGSRLSATTYSFYRPVASNDTSDGKAQNRRTEIVVYEN